MNQDAMRGKRETPFRGEYLHQLRACRARGKLFALGEDVRNLLRQILVRLVVSARRHDKNTKSEHEQKKRCEFFHNVEMPNDACSVARLPKRSQRKLTGLGASTGAAGCAPDMGVN